MANANKNLVKKMYTEIKNVIKKTRARRKRENVLVDILCSLSMVMYLVIFILIAVIDKTNSYGFVLNVLSIDVTYSFELYEWVYLFKKNKQNKHPLFPFLIAVILLIVLCIIVVCLPQGMSTFENFNNNLLCAVSLFIYTVLVTIRKIIEDLKA